MLEYLLNGRTRALSDVTDGRVGPSVAVTTLHELPGVEFFWKVFLRMRMAVNFVGVQISWFRDLQIRSSVGNFRG
jgi:hypothetical protein